MKPYMMLLAALLTVHAVAHEEDQQCAVVRKQMVPASLKVVDEIDASVETVPSDEASYLQTEYVASMRDHEQPRYSRLADRPYYAAWALHRSLARVRGELDAMGGSVYGESLERFQAKHAAFVMTRLSFAVNDWTAYARVDSARKPHVLDDQQQERYSEQLGSLSAILATYISCTVDAIK